MTLYEFEAKLNSGQMQSLAKYRGKVVLIVNTASNCGFTPQYEGLQQLYEKYRERGLVILAFPCNQFGQQESGKDSEIKSFCDLTFNISFPLFAKIDVNGDDAHPLYSYLKQQAPGLLNSKSVKWNFTKFLVSRDGTLIKRFAPTVKPDALTTDIEKMLAAS